MSGKNLEQHKSKPDSCKNSNMSSLTSLTDFFEWLQRSEMLYWNLFVPTNEHLPLLFSFSPFFPSSLYFTSLSWTVSSMHYPPPPPQYHYITPPISHTHIFTHRFQDQRTDRGSNGIKPDRRRKDKRGGERENFVSQGSLKVRNVPWGIKLLQMRC